MEEEIITIYCVCDDLLKALGLYDDPQAHMSNAEVMTVAGVAAWYYGGNLEKSRQFLAEQGYIPDMLGKSRYHRRLRAIPETAWEALLDLFATVFKHANDGQEYSLDSFPVPVCDNIRIRRCRLYQGEDYRGYIASKRRYFYGLRVHVGVTKTGEPVEFVLAPGARQDCRVLKQLNLDLPEGAIRMTIARLVRIPGCGPTTRLRGSRIGGCGPNKSLLQKGQRFAYLRGRETFPGIPETPGEFWATAERR